ncbi:MAG: acyltransferase [Oleispira sp.]
MVKVNAIEGIRGVACFMVVLSHLSLTFFPYLHGFSGTAGVENQIQRFIYDSPLGFMYSGSSAVYVFFVLSGYILTFAAFKNNISKIISMSIKRYPRLMIPVVISCFLSVLFFSVFSMDTSRLPEWISTYGDFDHSLAGAAYSGTVGAFLTGESLYNPVLWTMQTELIGSFVIFIMCFIKIKYQLRFLDFFIGLLLLLLLFFNAITLGLAAGLIAFIVGHLFYIHGKAVKPIVSLPLLVLGLYLAGAHNESSSYSLIVSMLGEKTYIVANFLSGMMIVYSIIFSTNLSDIFSKKIFVFMGRVSFSVYLIHIPIISIVGVFVFNILHNYFDYSSSAILSSIVSVLLTYYMAIYYFKYVDNVAMTLSSKFQIVVVGSFNKINCARFKFTTADTSE